LKAYSKQNNIPYAAAISDPRCRELYLESKNPKPVPAEFTETVPESQPAPVVDEQPLLEKPKKKRKRKKVVKSEE
jgi:hypothetical protein